MDEKQVARAKWNTRANIIILVLLVAGVFVYNAINPNEVVLISVEEDTLVLSGYEEVTYRIPLDTIDSLVYAEDVEYPEEEKTILHGTYSNEQWGEHILYVNGNVPACVVAKAASGTYVFNYESVSTTQALYEALMELL